MANRFTLRTEAEEMMRTSHARTRCDKERFYRRIMDVEYYIAVVVHRVSEFMFISV